MAALEAINGGALNELSSVHKSNGTMACIMNDTRFRICRIHGQSNVMTAGLKGKPVNAKVQLDR